jgi:hypothetical protein
MTAGLFVEQHAIESSGVPVDINGAGHVGDYYNLKYYGKITFILQQGAVGGAATPAVTLLQATTAAGGGPAKALGFTKRWTKVAITGTVPTETAVANNTFNLPAVANTLNIVEVNAEDLDVDGGFTFVSVNVADPQGAGYFLAVTAILSDPRYSGAPGTHLPDPKV